MEAELTVRPESGLQYDTRKIRDLAREPDPKLSEQQISKTIQYTEGAVTILVETRRNV